MEFKGQQRIDEDLLEREKYINSLIKSPFVDDYEPLHQLGPNHLIYSENIWTSERNGTVKLEMEWSSGPPPKSLISRMEERINATPYTNALAVNRDGRWYKWTYAQYWKEIRTAAKAFIKLGLKSFHGVGILGFNAPEWCFSAFGGILAGGLLAGIYATNSPEACYYVLNSSEANIVVVENEMQLKKILEVRDKLPNLKAIIQYTGQPTYPDVLSWKEMIKIGLSVPDEVLDRRIKGLAINQCCLLLFTAGTTKNSKPVMISHDNIVIGVLDAIKMGNIEFLDDTKTESGDSIHRCISFLPLCHIAGLASEILLPFFNGATVYFAPPDVFKGGFVDYVRAVRPCYMFGVPRVWEKIYENLKFAETQMSFIRRMIFRWACSVGYAYAENLQKGIQLEPFGFSLAKYLVFDKVKEALGFEKLICCWSGGGPINRELLKIFWSLNIIIFEAYGLSEFTGIISAANLNAFRLGSSGKITNLNHFRIHNRDLNGCGEICVRGRGRFMGYLNMPEETMKVISEDGWLHTGDIGHLDNDGFLFIVGRIKELIITAGGKNVCPIPIEDAVKQEISIIKNAMVIGDNRKFLAVLLTLGTNVNVETLIPTNELTTFSQEWCRSIGSDAKTVEDILNGPDTKVMKAIQEGIDRVNNQAQSNVERIKKWIVLPNDFSVPGGELTATLKLKRKFVVEKYSEIIEELYKESPASTTLHDRIV